MQHAYESETKTGLWDFGVEGRVVRALRGWRVRGGLRWG